VAGRQRPHVRRVRRAGVLGGGEQEAVSVLRSTQLREPCDVVCGARTRTRNQFQRASPAGGRTSMGGAVARRAGRGARVLLPRLRRLPGLVRGRRWRWARFGSADGSTSRRRPAPGCRACAGAQARSQPAEPARRPPPPAGCRAGAAGAGRPRPPIADSSRLWKHWSRGGCPGPPTRGVGRTVCADSGEHSRPRRCCDRAVMIPFSVRPTRRRRSWPHRDRQARSLSSPNAGGANARRMSRFAKGDDRWLGLGFGDEEVLRGDRVGRSALVLAGLTMLLAVSLRR